MAKRRIFFAMLFLIIKGIVYSQEKYTSFVDEMQYTFEKKKRGFENVSNRAIEKHFAKFTMPQHEYIYVVGLLLKKSKTLYETIDSTNMVQYFDPKTMFLTLVIVHDGYSYLGDISEHGRWRYIYNPKPNVFLFYEKLLHAIKEIQPEIVFEVQNVGRFFYIKDGELYALYSLGRGKPLVTCTIDEYTQQFKDDIFDPLSFKYLPRIHEVIVGHDNFRIEEKL